MIVGLVKIKNNQSLWKILRKQVHTPQEFGPKKFKCKSCDNSYTQSGNLRSLIKEVQEGFRNYECSTCGKRKIHMNGHILHTIVCQVLITFAHFPTVQ